MANVQSLLVKAKALYRKALADQPVDPLADLTPEERHYHQFWWAKFRTANLSTPEAFYAAAINRQGWTPNCMLDRSKVTNEMTLQDAADLYCDQLGQES